MPFQRFIAPFWWNKINISLDHKLINVKQYCIEGICVIFLKVPLTFNFRKSHQRPRSAPSSRNAPERQTSPGVDQTSPVLRAERELYKLREIMRQAEQVVEASPPQHPKLQKKFYGSESALSSSKSDSGSSIHKSDSSSSLKLKKKKSVNTSPVKSPKVRTSMSSRFQDSDPLSPPSKAKFETSPGEFDTPTRFDIGVMERSSSRRQHSDSLPTRDTGSKPRQSPATRDKRNGEVRGGNKAGRDRKPLKAEKGRGYCWCKLGIFIHWFPIIKVKV